MFKLLLVDDDMTFLDGLVKHMAWEKLGVIEIKTAHDGKEAWNICQSQKPDIILTDVRMPGIDGIELTVNIRESLPETQIIFMSAHSYKDYLKMAIRIRAIDYIEKPIDREELEAALLRATNLIRQDRNLEVTGEQYYNRTVEDIIQYITKHYSEKISIAFLASHVYVSPNYLSNLFKKETGKTINQFVTEIRIEKSKNMLINSYKSITEISNEIGYGDSRHFSKIFRKIVGKSPSEFRR